LPKAGQGKTENVLLVHLKMTGQLINSSGTDQQRGGGRIVGGHPTADWVGSLPSKHTRATISFQDGSRLYFNDQRKFGWMKLVDSDQWSVMKAKMPPDVVDESFYSKYLQMVLSKSVRAVKLVILDQAKIGGMGNIYANDALFMAKIHPEMPSNQLKIDAVNKLYEAMKFVINKGIETGGASYSHYVGIEGVGGHYQDHFLVYDQEGNPVSCVEQKYIR
jgi:formamidopyrimidine-DNA glycosylase